MRTTFGWTLGGALLLAVACGSTPQDPDDPGQTVHSSPAPSGDQGSMLDPNADPAPVGIKRDPDEPAPDLGASIHAQFQVEDYAAWKAEFDTHTQERVDAGQTWSLVGHLMEDNSQVVVRAGFRDSKKMQAWFTDPAMHETMKKAGVKGAPTVWMTENWARRPPSGDVIGMQTYALITSFKVADYKSWKAKFDAMETERRANGEFAYIIGRGLSDPDTVVLTLALSGDMPSVEAIMGSHDAKKAMHACGAKGEPEVWFSQTNETYWRGNDPVVFMRHKVADFDKWKAAFDAGAEARAEAGAKWHQVSRDKNNVVITVDGTDADDMKEFVESAELATAMKDAGVKGKPEMWWATEYEGVNHAVTATGPVTSFFIKHEVSDFDAWKKAYDAHRAMRVSSGVIADRVHRGIDNPNVVIVSGFAGDAKKLKKFLSGKGMKKAMKAAGVKGKPTIWTGTKVEQVSYAAK